MWTFYKHPHVKHDFYLCLNYMKCVDVIHCTVKKVKIVAGM